MWITEENNATNRRFFGSTIYLGHISKDGLSINVKKNDAFTLVIDPAMELFLSGTIFSGIVCTG